MIAEILATGDEIRSGALVDSNSAHIAELLEQNGVIVSRHHCVGDHMQMLTDVILEISRRADLAVITGGLGPTVDDLSAAAAAQAAGKELILNEQALQEIEQFFRKRGRTMTPSNRKQAMIPQSAVCMHNALGTAPGFEIKINKCLFFFLPGVPHEMRKMLDTQVLPRINAIQNSERRFCRTQTISTFGLPESVVGEKIADVDSVFPEIKLGLRAKFPEIQVKLYLNTTDEQRGLQALADTQQMVQERLGIHVFSTTDQTMASAVGDLLLKRQATLALAESCTGGLVANWLTNTAGSSDYFLFSAVTYANEAKVQVLGVSTETLAQYGAVHEQIARQMAEGARRIADADYGLAITGIAGPGGGTEDKPVGTVCIGLAEPDQSQCRRFFFPFSKRLMNKRIFAMTALDMLRRTLLDTPSGNSLI